MKLHWNNRIKKRCPREPGRRHGSGSADSFHILAVLYIRSVMSKGNILRSQELFVFEIRPPPLKTDR